MLFAAALCLQTSTPPTVKMEIPVHHVRPSIIYDSLMGRPVHINLGAPSITPAPLVRTTSPAQVGTSAGNASLRGGTGLVPSSITYINFDDRRAVLVVEGTSQDDIKDLTRTVELFDQVPKHVQTTVSLDSPSDHYQTKNLLEGINNEEWSVASGYAHIQVNGVDRINDDGTITVYLRISSGDANFSCVYRVKNNESKTLHLDQSTVTTGDENLYKNSPVYSGTTPTPPNAVKGSFPVPISVTIQPKIVE